MKNRETDEWMEQNIRSTRNFIRKWGHFVKHDVHLKPIVPPKYDIGLVVKNCTYQLLYELEPWCSTFYGEVPKRNETMYIRDEQPNTLIDLDERLQSFYNEKNNDIIVEFDCSKFTQNSFNIIQQLSEILSN